MRASGGHRYVANLRAQSEPFFADDAAKPTRIRLQLPSGYIIEIFEEKAPTAVTESEASVADTSFDVDVAHATIAAAIHE